MTRQFASRAGLKYAWVDTCCFDKSSSAELSEAINSMFRWYQRAEICYAYLSDLPQSWSVYEDLPKCRYFCRGWTLQEIIAPSTMVFLDQGWRGRGSKQEVAELLARITGVPVDILQT